MTSLPVTQQLAMAVQPKNRLAFALGVLLNFPIPLMVYFVSHTLPHYPVKSLAFLVMAPMCVAGMIVSMSSVVAWAVSSNGGKKVKAWGYAILLEGMLLMSGVVPELSLMGYAALSLLCLINAVYAGCAITLSAKDYKASLRAPRKATKKTK